MANQSSKMNKKTKEHRITRITQIFFIFLRLGGGIILHFHMSFCFLNFDILFTRKRRQDLIGYFFKEKNKMLIDNTIRRQLS